MKIGIIRKKYSFHGGAEQYTRRLIEQLTSSGNEVHIISSEWRPDDAKNNPLVTMHKVQTIPAGSFMRDLSFAINASAVALRLRLDIVQSHDKTLSQDIYRAGDGVHAVWLRQRMKYISPTRRLSILLNPYHMMILGLERKIFEQGRFKKIIAISEMVKRDILSSYKVPGSAIRVIYNGVDLSHFNPSNKSLFRDEIRRKHDIALDEPVALFVGSGFHRKGVPTLIRAVAEINEPFTLIVCGKGRPIAQPNMAGGARVIYTGPVQDARRYYAAADFFVFPSIYEPFGNVHIEALASGLPVISTSRCGGAELLTEGLNGYIIDDPADHSSLARAITLLLNPERRARMATEARKAAEKYSIESHVSQMLALYEEVSSAT